MTVESVQVTITPRQRDTILAALRFYQNPNLPPRELWAIATNDGEHESSLSDAEVDELIEEINPWSE